MKIVDLNEQKTIHGLTTRTNNAHEMNPAESRIGALAYRFDEQVVVDYKGGARVYGVYHEYESDVNGAFTVLIGADRVQSAKEKLRKVIIPKGRYLVFTGHGKVPQIVIDTWLKVWDYFADKNSDYKRAYSLDFEYYNGPNDVEIYIAIK
jgi:predicted transcriptional regulator YdeE